MQPRWDYLILTAANGPQAEAYERQVRARREAGALGMARETLVAPDTGGRRIGSGGSTLECLRAILRRTGPLRDFGDVEERLRGLRILILHAGGDSRRLPAYSPCGKIFVPLPGKSDGPVVHTVFDRLVGGFTALPAAAEGHMVVASGDALILFDRASVNLARPGITALGAPVTPEEAARHGVFCGDGQGGVRRYLQKPSLAEQRATGAIGGDGRTMLDVGVMSFSAAASTAMLRVFCRISEGEVAWRPEYEAAVLHEGLDIYREVCCALGSETTLDGYRRTARASGSKWSDDLLAAAFPALHAIPLELEPLRRCTFLHFGSTRQLIASGLALIEQDRGDRPRDGAIALTTEVRGGEISGGPAWLEACRVGAPLSLGGNNVVVGLDIAEPLRLAEGACIDVLRGAARNGAAVWFVRPHGIADTFKHALDGGAAFCGIPLAEWMAQAGVTPEQIWDTGVAAGSRTLWNARVFPAEAEPGAYRRWLWMFAPAGATAAQKRAFARADRYSAAEIALLADQEHFSASRQAIHDRGRAAELEFHGKQSQ